MKAIFLAGGAGTRLWPLSRVARPKQLHALISEKSLITQTVDRVGEVISPEDVWIITGESLKEQIVEQCPLIPAEHLVTEPYPLGTNLAVGLGLIHLAAEDPDATILLGWADSYVGNPTAFIEALKQAEALISHVEGIILGVPPTYPATCFGYIEAGRPVLLNFDAASIIRFEEKPSRCRAETFVQSGRHFWNPGFSVWRVSKLLDLMRVHIPEHYEALQDLSPYIGTAIECERITASFKHLQPISIDNAVFEKAAGLAVIPVNMDWNDIGSWGALCEVQNGDHTLVTKGNVVTVDTDNCLIHSNGRLIATLGVSDLVIVETDDTVLVVHKDQTDRLKELYDEVKKTSGDKYL